MEIVTLRRAGGSLVITIPKTYARELGLAEGESVGVSVSGGKLVADPSVGNRPRYRLQDLLAECDPGAPVSDEDEIWLAEGPVGNERL